MEVSINLQKIKERGLTPTFYVLLLSLYRAEIEFPWTVEQHHLEYLQKLGYLKITPDGPVLTGKLKLDFPNVVKSLDIEQWIEEWRALFPAKVESGGRPVKGSKQGCLKKMKSFINKHPDVTVEEIFEATKIYIFSRKRENYNFMTTADYFIEKNNVSLLESLIEKYRETPSLLKELEEGRGTFFKQI